MATLTTYMYVHVHDSFRYKNYYLHDQQKDAEYLGRVGPGEIEESAWQLFSESDQKFLAKGQSRINLV